MKLVKTLTALILTLVGLASAKAETTRVVEVDAPSLISHVCGKIDPTNTDVASLQTQAREQLGVDLQQEDDDYWLDGEDGYALLYRGMQPEVAVLVHFEDGVIADYTYFFTFPYTSTSQAEANEMQGEFCSAMLQELKDNNAMLGVNTMPVNSLFEVVGTAEDRDVNLRLVDDEGSQYIFIMEVAPAEPLTAQTR